MLLSARASCYTFEKRVLKMAPFFKSMNMSYGSWTKALLAYVDINTAEVFLANISNAAGTFLSVQQ